MKRFLLFFSILGFLGCNQFPTKKISSQEILSQEQNQLNWHEVDQYPAFESCTGLMEKEAARTCFENKVVQIVYAKLEEKQPVVGRAIHDTLWLQLVISKKGVPRIDSVTVDSTIMLQLPHIKKWLRESIASLPKIAPANKRGLPVATKFEMPIIITAQ